MNHRQQLAVVLSLCSTTAETLAAWPNAAWPRGGWRQPASDQRLGVARTTRHALPPLPNWIAGKVIAEAEKQGLDPHLALALVAQESAGNPYARSATGAMGLTQLMPATARALRVADPFDPDENLRGGLRYLKEQIQRFGSLPLALAAYNSGPDRVAQLNRLPAIRETRNYVTRICGAVPC